VVAAGNVWEGVPTKEPLSARHQTAGQIRHLPRLRQRLMTNLPLADFLADDALLADTRWSNRSTTAALSAAWFAALRLKSRRGSAVSS
jgi:hypothetical protein